MEPVTYQFRADLFRQELEELCAKHNIDFFAFFFGMTGNEKDTTSYTSVGVLNHNVSSDDVIGHVRNIINEAYDKLHQHIQSLGAAEQE